MQKKDRYTVTFDYDPHYLSTVAAKLGGLVIDNRFYINIVRSEKRALKYELD